MRHSGVYFAALLLCISVRSHAQTTREHVQLVAGTSAQASVGGLVNVLTLGAGTAINDGNVHTVGTAPAGSMFYGINSLAGLAALTINGTTPFSFLTSSGSVIGPMATPGSASNPFTSPTGAYKLTDAAVGSLDIAWLALQSAYLTGTVYVPPGTYVVGSARALPLMIPLSFDGGGMLAGVPTRIHGDGPRVSNIKAGSDFGAAIPLASCGDPMATAANGLGRFAGNAAQCSGTQDGLLYEGPGTNWYWPVGTTSYQMDGFAPGPRHRTQDVEAAGFNHDWLIDGDHTLFIRAHATGGAHGFYWDGPNPALTGDLEFTDLVSSGASEDAIEVGPNASVSGTFDGETYLSAPIAIRGDSGACKPILYDVLIRHLMAEYIGQEVIADDTGFNSTTNVYTDANKCRSVTKLGIDDFYWSYSNNNWAAGRQRRAIIDVNDISGYIDGLQTDTGIQSPNSVPAPNGSANTPVAFLNVHSVQDATTGFKLSGNISNLIAQMGTLPLVPPTLAVPAFITLEQPGVWSGGLSPLYVSGNYASTTIGDLLEPDVYQGVAAGGTNYTATSQPVLGVAMQGGLIPGGYQTGPWVPFASSGIVAVNVGWPATGWGAYTKNTGIGSSIMLATGKGYAAGTYVWSCSIGGCAGTVTVNSLGQLAAYTITNHGTNLSAVPTIAVPSGAGAGSGGAITAVWPSGLAVRTPTYAAPVIGSMVGGYAGGGKAGSILIRLAGMQ